MRSRLLILVLLPMLVSCEAWTLERAGRSKCEEGKALVFRVMETTDASRLTGAARDEARADLKKGTDLLKEGLSSLAKAAEKSGTTYDVTPYLKALKVARMALLELRD